MVDILIRAKNGQDLTSILLDSIIENTPHGSYRIILVDDGSAMALDTMRCDYNVRCRTSHGAVTATNMGLGVSLNLYDSDYVLILDNDTEIPAGDVKWLERFVAELEQAGPLCAAVGATSDVVNPPQQIMSVPQTYMADWDKGVKENPAVVWFVSFAVLMRKDVLREVGLWDERYNPGNYEDTDYSVSLRLAGYEIKVARSVYLHHKGHATFSDKLMELLEVNGAKFQEKWGLGRLWDMGYFSNEQVTQMLLEAKQ